MASCEACLSTLITVTVVHGDGCRQRVEVDALDEVRSLAERTSIHCDKYVHNGQVLVPAMSFAYYGITNNSIIVGVNLNPPSPPRSKKSSRRWFVDESRPIRLETSVPISEDHQKLLCQYFYNKLMPGRARAIAKIADNRLTLGERHIGHMRRIRLPEPVNHDANNVVELNIARSEKPGEAALPLLCDPPEDKSSVQVNVVIVALSPSPE